MENYGFNINVSGNAKQQLAGIQGQASKLGGIASSIKGMIFGAFGIGAALEGFHFIQESIEAYDKLEESVMKVETVLKSTGHAAGLSLGEIEESAKKMSKQVLFSRASIMDAQSMLLTFTQIKDSVFEEAMPAITDFATRFKMELPEAANMVGKALNDPLKGMTRLQRQGVVFSAAQKKQIEGFMKMGKVAEAQRVILDELKTEFGGLAHAMTLTDEGKLAMAKKKWGEIKLTIGEIGSKTMVALIPVFDMFMTTVKSFFATLKESYENLVYSLTITKNIIMGLIRPIIDLKGKMDGLFGNPMIAKIVEFLSKMNIFKVMTTGLIEAFGTVAKVMTATFAGMAAAFEDLKNFKFGAMAGDFKKAFSAVWNKKEEHKEEHKVKASPYNRTALQEEAMNTSALGGARGGLGEAKVVNIRIENMLKINANNVDKAVLEKDGQLTVEELIRILNDVGSVTVKM